MQLPGTHPAVPRAPPPTRGANSPRRPAAAAPLRSHRQRRPLPATISTCSTNRASNAAHWSLFWLIANPPSRHKAAVAGRLLAANRRDPAARSSAPDLDPRCLDVDHSASRRWASDSGAKRYKGVVLERHLNDAVADRVGMQSGASPGKVKVASQATARSMT